MPSTGLPLRQGLYDPRLEHDSCGVGFVVDLQGRKSHDLVQKAIRILLNLEHRGACGCEKNTGDGAGILLQTPDAFLRRVAAEARIKLPEAGEYGVGMVFLPTDAQDRAACEGMFEQVVREEGQIPLGWRTVPTYGAMLGNTARQSQPVVRQIFVGHRPSPPTPLPACGERGEGSGSLDGQLRPDHHSPPHRPSAAGGPG